MNTYVLKKLIVPVTVLLLLLSGCSLAYGDGLLSLPKLPGEYVQLQREFDEILTGGASYAVAELGANRQAVQLVDLDGDGATEALAFFRTADNLYKVYAYRQTETGYVRFDVAEGYGGTLRSIYYPQIGAQKAVALGWGYSDNTEYGMTVFLLTPNGFETLLDLTYNDALIEDLDGDGYDEMAFAVRDSITALFSARIYKWQQGGYAPLLESAMCLEVKSVAKMQFGATRGGRQALFIDSVSTSGGYVSDVISYDGRAAENESIDQASGSGMATWRAVSVFSDDIDGDGCIEVPVGRTGENEQRQRLSWCVFAGGRAEREVCTTYHSPSESWYLMWPESWGDRVSVSRTSSMGSTRTAFSISQAGEVLEGENREELRTQLLVVWTFTGDNREEHLSRYRNLTVFRTTPTAIYCYARPENDFPKDTLTDAQLAELLRVSENSWKTEEY